MPGNNGQGRDGSSHSKSCTRGKNSNGTPLEHVGGFRPALTGGRARGATPGDVTGGGCQVRPGNSSGRGRERLRALVATGAVRRFSVAPRPRCTPDAPRPDEAGDLVRLLRRRGPRRTRAVAIALARTAVYLDRSRLQRRRDEATGTARLVGRGWSHSLRSSFAPSFVALFDAARQQMRRGDNEKARSTYRAAHRIVARCLGRAFRWRDLTQAVVLHLVRSRRKNICN